MKKCNTRTPTRYEVGSLRDATVAEKATAYDSVHTRSAEGWVVVNVPNQTGQAEFRQDEFVGALQHLRMPAVAGSTVQDDFQAILTDQQNARAGWFGSVLPWRLSWGSRISDASRPSWPTSQP
jgi:hypothetical protein